MSEKRVKRKIKKRKEMLGDKEKEREKYCKGERNGRQKGADTEKGKDTKKKEKEKENRSKCKVKGIRKE